MLRMKKLLALVMVMAMTLSMLPTFAAADEIAAVETVAELSEIPAETQTVEAIETAPAEPVAPLAELQASSTSFTSDADAVAAGYYWKTVNAEGTTYYTVPTEIPARTLDNDEESRVYLLCDLTIIDENNYSDPMLSLTNLTQGWIDLGGHTLTAKAARPVIGRVDGWTSVKIKNGTIIHQNGYLAESTVDGKFAAGTIVVGARQSNPTSNSGEHTLFPIVNLVNTKVISLTNYTGSPAPAVNSTFWNTTVTLTNSIAVSENTYGVCFDLGRENMILPDVVKNCIEEYGKAECNVILNGISAVGSLNADCAAVGHRYHLTEANTPNIEFSLNVTVNDPQTVTVFGASLAEQISGVEDLNITTYDDFDFTETMFVLPDADTIQGGVNMVPDDCAEPRMCAAWTVGEHIHNAVRVEATPATYTQTGNLEYWRCAICGLLFEDEACTIETTLDAVTIPKLPCDHSAKEHCDVVSPTFTKTGLAEHWYCPACETYWEADGTTETTLSALAIDKLEEGLTVTGLSDDKLVEMGAVFKLSDPNGINSAYLDLGPAIEAANAWTQPGGEVKLLRDYTIINTEAASTVAVYEIAPETNTYHAHDATIDDDLYGYWIDLGGHTLAAKMARSLFGNSANGAAVNIRNGHIIYWNYTGTQFLKGVVAFGQTGTAPYGDSTDVSTLKTARVTFSNVEAVNISTYADGNAIGGKDVVASTLWSNIVRLYDSTIISNCSGGVGFVRSQATVSGAALADIRSRGVQNGVELHGTSILGSLQGGAGMNTNATTQAMRFQYYSNDKSTGTYSGIDHVVTVTADETSRFLGSGLIFDRTGEATVNAPAGIAVNFGGYSYELPDRNGFPASQGEGAPTRLAAADFSGFSYVAEHTHGIDVTYHPATAPTLAAAGHSAYYQCSCGNVYLDEACTQETTLDAVTIPKLEVGFDSSPYTDEELAAMGAVMRVTNPDGSETAYASISDAFTKANSWTKSGGVVRLVQDAFYIDSFSSSKSIDMNTPLITIDSITNTYHAYDETIDADLYGYWIDLGGHTFAANVTRPLFGNANDAAVNIRNGQFFYRATTKTAPGRAAIALGTRVSSTAPYSDDNNPNSIKVGRVTFSNVEAVNITNYSDITTTNGKHIVLSGLWNNIIRLYNGAKVISDYSGAVGFVRSTGSVSGAALADIQERGVQNDVELHGGSILGSLQSGAGMHENATTAAIRFQYYEGGSSGGCDHVVSVTADATSRFLGSDLVHDRTGELTVHAPEGVKMLDTPYSYAKPSRDGYPTATTYGATAGRVATASDYDCFYYAEHTHGVTVTSHPAVAATFAAAGHSAYYECDCGELFLDEACTVPTTLEEVTTGTKLVDASGYTDAQLVELGAVIRATAPNAATDKAYDNILDGYEEAKNWTEAGGTLKLLTDVTIDMEGNFAGGYLTAESYDYDNTEVAGMATKGFWLDLDGHTIRASLGRALIYSERSTYTNVKNGTIIFTDNGRQTSSGNAAKAFGIFTYGTSSVGSDKATSINLYQVNCYALKTEGHKTDPAVIAGYYLNMTVNVKDSKLITDSAESAIETYRTSNTGTGITDANININLTGGSMVGSLTNTTNAMHFDDYNATTAAIDGVTYRINVNADSDTTFLGNAPSEVVDSIAALYTVTTPDSTYACVTRNLAFPAISLAAADYKAWVDPLADAAGLTTDDPTAAKATLTYGGNTAYFTEIADALTYAETIGSQTLPTKVTLNANATETVKLGAEGHTSAFTLDLNGFEIPEAGLIEAGGGAGTKITITIAAGAAGEAAIFAGLPALAYADGSVFVIEKGSLFTDYSLNLEDHVKMNLYTKSADGVSYVQGGTTHVIEAKDDKDAWIVDTIAARQMFEPIDAYAVKTEGTTTTIDFTKGISVKRYVDGDPAATLADGAEKTALEATLETLLIYGKFAEKYFASDYTDLSADELTALGIDAIPVTDTTNLTDAAYVVTGMDDLQYAPEGTGFYGIVAEPDESMSLKFYFSGDVFDGKTATVNGEAAEVETFGDYKFVEAVVRARDFDTAITVAIDGVGSVTDSVSGYTSRMTHANTVKLGQALRAYGANAMRYAAAKDAAQG